jgi:hypothetical protein
LLAVRQASARQAALSYLVEHTCSILHSSIVSEGFFTQRRDYLSAVKLLASIPRRRHHFLALKPPPVAAVRAHLWITAAVHADLWTAAIDNVLAAHPAHTVRHTPHAMVRQVAAAIRAHIWIAGEVGVLPNWLVGEHLGALARRGGVYWSWRM